MGKIIVAKFGGTSLADAKAINQAAKVTIQNKVSLVVVSATHSTTNSLVDLAKAVFAKNQLDAERIVLEIITNHTKIAEELGGKKELLAILNEIFTELRTIATNTELVAMHKKKLTDRILGYGEQLSSELIVVALRNHKCEAEIIDARQVIKTDSHFGYATPLVGEISAASKQIIRPRLRPGCILVTQGFIGSSPANEVTTLGRGGSDYSAALLAEAINAQQLQIWTDTSGISSADPRIIKGAKKIDHLSFQEAAELATAGARVLYPKTITPTRRAKIPVFVGSTFAPEEGGTTISDQSDEHPLVRAVAIKTNQFIVRLATPEMAHQFGYLAKVFDLFAKFKISVDQISTSEISVAVVLENQMLINKKLFGELEKLGEVSIEKGLSVISLIGNNVNKAPGLAQEIFANLEDEGEKISVRMICQGASYHNFCFVITDKHGLNMVNKLHKVFIERSDKK